MIPILFSWKKWISLFVLSVFLFIQVIPQNAEVCLETQSGKASFYALSLNGKRTASGEKFNSKEYTCAHRSLPFGTYIKVTNLDNCKTVVVKVNDRGPFVRGRIIDLSYIAAKELQMIGNGTAKVSIEVLGATKEEADQNQALSENIAVKYSFED